MTLPTPPTAAATLDELIEVLNDGINFFGDAADLTDDAAHARLLIGLAALARPVRLAVARAERRPGWLEPRIRGPRGDLGGRLLARDGGDLRAVAPDLRRRRETAEVGRSRLLRAGQARHVTQVGCHAVGQRRRQHGLRDRHRLLPLAEDRQREGAGAEGSEV